MTVKKIDSQQQRVLKLKEEVVLVFKHFKLLQCKTGDDIRRLPQWVEESTKQVGKDLLTSRLETDFLRKNFQHNMFRTTQNLKTISIKLLCFFVNEQIVLLDCSLQ